MTRLLHSLTVRDSFSVRDCVRASAVRVARSSLYAQMNRRSDVCSDNGTSELMYWLNSSEHINICISYFSYLLCQTLQISSMITPSLICYAAKCIQNLYSKSLTEAISEDRREAWSLTLWRQNFLLNFSTICV